MKKIVTMLLVVVMVLGLAACGSKTTTPRHRQLPDEPEDLGR